MSQDSAPATSSATVRNVNNSNRSSRCSSQQQQQQQKAVFCCFQLPDIVQPRTRLAVGIACLLGVVIIWVLSSELTRFIFVQRHFNKPFFTTYFKTALFTLYLTGFLCLPNWRHLCSKGAAGGWGSGPSFNRRRRQRDSRGGYTRVGDEEDASDADEVDEGVAVDGEDEDVDDGFEDEEGIPALSDPRYVPVRFDSSSDAESVASLSINSDLDSARPEQEGAGSALITAATPRDEQSALLGSNAQAQADSTNSAQSPSSSDLNADGSHGNSGQSSGGGNRGVRFSRLSEVRQLSDSHAHAANMARLSYVAYLRAIESGRDPTGRFFGVSGRRLAPLSVMEVAKLALLFCLVWFLGNWSYQEALNRSPAGVVNVVSTSSSLFTLILSSMFPSDVRDKFSLSKLLAVLLCSAGVAMISWSDLTVFHQHSHVPWGTAFALLGSLCYAIYLVMLKRKARSETALSFPMFFGFVGLFNALLLWPGFFVWNRFRLPNNTDWGFLTLNGIVGTTLSELLWLWGCFLATSLLATLSLSLTIPLTMAADFLIDKVQYDWRFYCGSVPVFLSFVIVAFLSNSDDPDYDPALAFLTRCRQMLSAAEPTVGVSGRGGVRRSAVARQ
uniref:Solute carrier family 35 member F5 n=1 Tax=Macrostomum lignano TaxID=282301 RepID=A0A1I8H4W5_9PLAT